MSQHGRYDLVLMWSQVLLFCFSSSCSPVSSLPCRHWQLCVSCYQNHNMYTAEKSGFCKVFWYHAKVSGGNKQGRKTPQLYSPCHSVAHKTYRCFPLRNRLTHLTRGHTLFSISCLKLKGTFMLILGLLDSEINFLLLFLKNTSNIDIEEKVSLYFFFLSF